MTLNHILRKCTVVYQLSRLLEKINHLKYMDDITLFVKNEKPRKTLIHSIRIYSQGIGMKFRIEKCTMLVMKRGKRHLTDGMELPITTKSERSEKVKPTNIRVSWTVTPSNKWKWKTKFKKEYLRRIRKLLETKLSCRNLIKGINTRPVPLVRYSGSFLKWTRDELKWTKEQEN